MRLIVTGGTGYIGSHTVVALQEAGHEIAIIDNLYNSERGVVDRIARISGKRPEFFEVDLCDAPALRACLASWPAAAVLHFAGLKAVGESVAKPLAYYQNNVHGTLNLLEAMEAAQVRTLVFSSSATVYGEPERLPIDEAAATRPTNPYGRCKLMVEEILGDLGRANASWRIACLRYFNPVGAHKSGLIGELPRGAPNNLAPFVAQVAAGKRDRLMVFGNDYDTPDGTGLRDYIHVLDLAAGHLAALQYLLDGHAWITVNLGTGRAYSVFEMMAAFKRASGRDIPYQVVARRPGDVASCFADASLAARALGWQAKRRLDEMCEDAWRWQQNGALN